jgi:conjugal transfer/entry exclusion protein
MKRLLAFLLLLSTASAQWVVHDPVNTAVNSAVHAGQAANHLETMRRWAQQIEGLNRQLRELQQQLEVQRRILDVLGNPTDAGAQMILREFGADELARSFSETMHEVRRLSSAVASLERTADGLYSRLENRTILGRSFNRQESSYRRYAAVERQTDNLAAVQSAVTERSNALQRDLADTLDRLKGAATQAEVDKLQAKVAAINGQLAHLDSQREDELRKLLAAQVANENQAAKERQDLLERQLAEERDSTAALNAWQRSFKLSPTSYTNRE